MTSRTSSGRSRKLVIPHQLLNDPTAVARLRCSGGLTGLANQPISCSKPLFEGVFHVEIVLKGLICWIGAPTCAKSD
jgi:hypothetical protein